MTVPTQMVINLETGEEAVVELTPEEITAAEAAYAAEQEAIAAIIPPTPEEKLAAAGLTVDELKSLLGLK